MKIESSDNENTFLNYYSILKGFYSPFERLTLAGRLEGEKISGSFPYYRAAYIGGGHSLRGYKSHRFAGDQAVSASAEVRIKITRRRVIFPSDIGTFFYSDGGRVWFEDKSPDDWHITGGAGVYIAPLMRDYVIRFSVARSENDTRIYWDLGFAF